MLFRRWSRSPRVDITAVEPAVRLPIEPTFREERNRIEKPESRRGVLEAGAGWLEPIFYLESPELRIMDAAIAGAMRRFLAPFEKSPMIGLI